MMAAMRLLLASFAIVSLYAQQPSEAELNHVAVTMDAALQVHPGAVIADIGTGLAVQHPFRIAREVQPGGRVVCVEISEAAVARIKTRAEAEHIPDLQVKLGTDEDPGLPDKAFDSILVSNTYHEFTHPESMLKHLCDALKPNGRVVIVENYAPAGRNDSRADQAKRHDMAPQILEPELAAAGLAIKEIGPIYIDPNGRVRYLVAATRANQ